MKSKKNESTTASRFGAASANQPLCSNLASKRRGEVAEAAFLLKAATLGFSVAKPWGDSDRYDFIVDSGHRSWRVQVKSAFSTTHGHSFRAAGCVATKTYTADDIDFLVAYIAARDIWYVIPITAFDVIGSIKLHPYPKRRPSRFEKYREAWCLMACPKDGQCRKEIELERCCQHGSAGAGTRCPMGR